MKIYNYIIQGKGVEKAKALENLQRQAIFLTNSYHAHQAMLPFMDEKPVTVEYAISMKQETEKFWRNWEKNRCEIKVKLVDDQKLPEVYKEIKSFVPDTKTPEQPLGMYWLANLEDSIPSAELVKRSPKEMSEAIHTLSLWVDVENTPFLAEYLDSL
jgi:hypothetical protein